MCNPIQQQDQQQQQDKQQGEKDEGDKQQQQQSGEQSDEQQEQQQQQEAEAQQQQAQEQEAKEQEGQAVPLDPSKMTDEEVDRILQAAQYFTDGDWVRLSLDSGTNDRMPFIARSNVTTPSVCLRTGSHRYDWLP